LVKDGRYIESALRREGLREADIEVALRRQNANRPEEVAAESSSGDCPDKPDTLLAGGEHRGS
jgi:hypothetical protein